MTINAKKSKLLHSSLFMPYYAPDFMLDSKKLEVCQTAKLLGVTFDSQLTFHNFYIKFTFFRFLNSSLNGNRQYILLVPDVQTQICHRSR